VAGPAYPDVAAAAVFSLLAISIKNCKVCRVSFPRRPVLMFSNLQRGGGIVLPSTAIPASAETARKHPTRGKY